MVNLDTLPRLPFDRRRELPKRIQRKRTKGYGEPRFELSIYREQTRRWWFNVWQREEIPKQEGSYAVMDEQ